MKLRANPLAFIRTAGKRYFLKNSAIGRETIESPGSWKILDRLYGNEPGKTDQGTFLPEHWTDRMFFRSRAAKATRTRFEEYVGKMMVLGETYAAKNGGMVRILSLASGPGRDVMEVARVLRDRDISVSGVCADRCAEAVELGSALARKHDLKGVLFRKCRMSEIRRFESRDSFDIVITQGILDYLDEGKAVDLLTSAREVSREGGTLITSNMGKHFWMRFWMEFFGEWRLKYRRRDELAAIMRKSGYRDANVYLLPEGYHWMGIGIK